jgi:hypothetical protein
MTIKNLKGVDGRDRSLNGGIALLIYGLTEEYHRKFLSGRSVFEPVVAVFVYMRSVGAV